VILSRAPLADRLVFRGVERPIPDHDQRPGIRIVADAESPGELAPLIRALTGVFTTLLQIMSDEPASSSWLPDADALDRPCRILFAIAVISDEAPPQSN